MPQAHQPAAEAPALLPPGATFETVTAKVTSLVLTPGLPLPWLAAVGLSGGLAAVLLGSIGYLIYRGIGIWGNNQPADWGWDITNFVWWVGIAHAGTFISAILTLTRQEWRRSIGRIAEAMTLFSVACAGLFPLIHMGRCWIFYWLFPYPNTLGMWPQWRSPLVWDAFAVSTYGTVSLIFWYLGMIPDLATLRDRARSGWVRRIYGLASLGWRNSARHWERYEKGYTLLAGVATSLVVAVSSIVALDMAAALTNGWHSTIFPLYFVLGALFSGFAMVLVLLVPIRRLFRLQEFITVRHLDHAAKLMLAMGLIINFIYLDEAFTEWLHGGRFDLYHLRDNWTGHYGPYYWTLISCNVVIIQLAWFKRVRTSPLLLFAIGLAVNVGMWCERFIIIVMNMRQDFMPSGWGEFNPTFWDGAIYLGTIGLFLLLLLLFLRFLPVVPMSELRGLVAEVNPRGERPAGTGPAR